MNATPAREPVPPRYRVAMVAACPFPCERGTPIRIQRLAEALVGRGHEVHVVTYHLGEPIAPPGVRVHRVPDVATYRRLEPGPTLQKLLVVDPLLTWKLARVLRAHDFDIIHAHHIEGLIAALLARRGRRYPLVFDAHTLVQSELPHYDFLLPRLLKRGLGWLLDRALPLRADYIVAVTEEIRSRLIALGAADPARSAVIANGVEADLFEETRRRDRAGSKRRTIVFTGNLAAYQGVEAMLRAFAIVHGRRPEVSLMIVSRSSFDPFEALAQALGIRPAIELVEAGFEAVPGRLALSDIALNPRAETPGLPHKTLNYMAAGLPIVSFAGSGKHLIDGETALLVAEGGIEGFAAAIERLLDDPALAERLGASARALVRAEMSWTQSAELTEHAYREAIALVAARAAAPLKTTRTPEASPGSRQ